MLNASNLIERFGDQAYAEASSRARHDDYAIDGNRPDGHWRRVKLEIARRQGIEGRFDRRRLARLKGCLD
jgi:hypothetical protein